MVKRRPTARRRLGIDRISRRVLAARTGDHNTVRRQTANSAVPGRERREPGIDHGGHISRVHHAIAVVGAGEGSGSERLGPDVDELGGGPEWKSGPG